MARLTENEIMERIDKVLEAIERLEALIAKREHKLHTLYASGHLADQFGDVNAEEAALERNRTQLLKKQEMYFKLNARLMEA